MPFLPEACVLLFLRQRGPFALTLSTLTLGLLSTPAHAAGATPLVLLGRLHFPLLHFPLVLLVVACFFEVALRTRVDLRKEINDRLLPLAAVFAVITVVAGLAHAEGEEFNGAAANTFWWHRGIGIGVAVVSVLLLLVRRTASLARAYLPLLALGVVGVSVTGHFGGTLVHGENFYTAVDGSDDTGAGAGLEDVPTVSYDDSEGAGAARNRHPEGVIVAKPDYELHIKPLFQRSCVKCHGPEKRKSGLRLDEKRFALKGGESGPTALVPGDADKSLIFSMCSMPADDEDVMPPKGKLLALSEIETLKHWIDQGALWPEPRP